MNCCACFGACCHTGPHTYCETHQPLPLVAPAMPAPTFVPSPKVPHRCPVCHGSGHVGGNFYNQLGLVTTASSLVPCRSCGGTGVLWS